jgi:hypothetical protein
MKNGVAEITVSRCKSLYPIGEEAFCTCIAFKRALNCGESTVAVGDRGGTMFGSCASWSLSARIVCTWSIT